MKPTCNKAYPMTNNLYEFLRWYQHAKPGECVIYYTGDLMYDRAMGDLHAKNISAMAYEVWKIAAKDELHLLQKRVGPNHYEYRAVRTAPRNVAEMMKKLRRPLSAHQILRTA